MDGQRRPSDRLATIGVTLPSPRVTPETSVVGSMRRSGHGTPAEVQTLGTRRDAAMAEVPAAIKVESLVESPGLVIDGSWLTPLTAILILGGAIIVMRLTPPRRAVAPSAGTRA